MPDPATREAVRRKLEQVRNFYAARLNDKLDELGEALRQSRGEGGEARLRDTLRLAHNVAGTASVLGIRSVGLAALELEKQLDRALESGLAPDWLSLEQCLQHLRDTMLQEVPALLAPALGDTAAGTFIPH